MLRKHWRPLAEIISGSLVSEVVRELFIYRAQQSSFACWLIILSHGSSHVWMRLRNLLFLGWTGEMQSLAGSSEIQGTGAVYPTHRPAACAGASPMSQLLMHPACCSLTLSQLPGVVGVTETITPCASSHLETVTPCDFCITLEVTVQLNADSQAWRSCFQLIPDCMECGPGSLTMRNGPAKLSKAIQQGKEGCQDIWKLAA